MLLRIRTVSDKKNCRINQNTHCVFNSIFFPLENRTVYKMLCGPGSSVSIVTEYGLGSPGSNPGGDEIFRLSRPTLGPTQPTVKWVGPGGEHPRPSIQMDS